MRVAFDTSILLLLLDQNAAGPIDPNTGALVHRLRERVEYLIQTISAAKRKAIIPTPVLAEVLANSGAAGSNYLSIIHGSSAMEVAPFDIRSAIELAALETQLWGPARPTPQSTRQKVKVDRQIIAVAKVAKVETIYSDDSDMKSLGAGTGINVVHSWELPIPPQPPQIDLPFD